MEKRVKVFSFTSGKGGVGKTNLIVNTAIELSRRGKKVLLIDTDMGLANVDIVLGLAPRYNLKHLFSGEKTLEEIIVNGPLGLKILPASSGIQELTHLSDQEAYGFFNAIEQFHDFDYILLDTGAGISDNVLYFNAAAKDVFVIVTPEPTSLTDSYAIIKVLNQRHKMKRFKIIANMVGSQKEGNLVFQRLNKVAGHFLNVALDYAGFVYADKLLNQAVIKQTPFVLLYPKSSLSACIRGLANQIMSQGFLDEDDEGPDFWQRVVQTG